MNGVAILGPIFALLLTGMLLRKMHFPAENFWSSAERLSYYVLIPALLINSLSTASFAGRESAQLILATLILLLFATLITFVVRHLWLNVANAVFTSYFQGSIRFNTFVALAVAYGIFGHVGVAWGALVAAIMIPVINLMCVVVFAKYVAESPSFYQVTVNIVKNPLILGSVAGIIINLSGGLPKFLLDYVEFLSRMALPLGLLCVGAALNIKALMSAKKALVFSSIIKLLCLPLIAWVVARVLHLDHELKVVLMVFAAAPTAISSYILARQLGGDDKLMAAIITTQTLVSMVTIPWVMWLAGVGS